MDTAVRLAKEVLGPPRRTIFGEEFEQLMMIFSLLEPIEISNNQQCITETYVYAGKTYNVCYISLGLDPVIEEIDDLIN